MNKLKNTLKDVQWFTLTNAKESILLFYKDKQNKAKQTLIKSNLDDLVVWAQSLENSAILKYGTCEFKQLEKYIETYDAVYVIHKLPTIKYLNQIFSEKKLYQDLVSFFYDDSNDDVNGNLNSKFIISLIDGDETETDDDIIIK